MSDALFGLLLFRATVGSLSAVSLPFLARADRRPAGRWVLLAPALAWVVSGAIGAPLVYAVWTRATERGQPARRWTLLTALLPIPGYLAYRAWDDARARRHPGLRAPLLAGAGGLALTAGLTAGWLLAFRGDWTGAVGAWLAGSALLGGALLLARHGRPPVVSPTLTFDAVVRRAEREGIREPGGGALLEARNLVKRFAAREGRLRHSPSGLAAVAGVSMALRPGETLAIVGESGSGKTTLARMLLGLLRPDGGDVLYEGVPASRLSRGEWRALRREIQVVFQDPVDSLDPRMTVGSLVAEPLAIHGLAEGAARHRLVEELCAKVGLDPAVTRRYPHELSGGQRQRVAIARALAPRPRVLVCDEPVSALDVSVQAQVINLLSGLREEMGLALILIAHDLSVVRHMSDRVAVMYLGKVVEIGPAGGVLRDPLHPYTEALLASVPRVQEPGRRPLPLRGEAPNPLDPPSGCRFRTRCPLADDRCRREEPSLEDKVAGHRAACHHSRLGDGPPGGRRLSGGETFSVPPP